MGSIQLDQVIFEIIPDDTPENPRGWDNLGTMVCWHRRYALGDPHDYHDPQEFTTQLHAGNAIILPLFLFDHSGLTMRTDSARFHACDPAGWDWGQVGYIYTMKVDVRKAYGVKHITRRLNACIQQVLQDEVETYSQYLHGEVYGFTLTDRLTGEVVDACWGFYGENPHRNGMAESLPREYREEILSYFYQGAA
ncbi:MAG: hypothetical protein ACYDBB_04680 [Armatimonadota bacterium]